MKSLVILLAFITGLAANASTVDSVYDPDSPNFGFTCMEIDRSGWIRFVCIPGDDLQSLMEKLAWRM